MTCGADAGGAVHVDSGIALLGANRFAYMQTHSNAHGSVGQPLLRFGGGSDRI